MVLREKIRPAATYSKHDRTHSAIVVVYTAIPGISYLDHSYEYLLMLRITTTRTTAATAASTATAAAAAAVAVPLYMSACQRQLMGRTLMDPKKDSKWERGRTRQALHFGAHVRGGRAVGAEV